MSDGLLVGGFLYAFAGSMLASCPMYEADADTRVVIGTLWPLVALYLWGRSVVRVAQRYAPKLRAKRPAKIAPTSPGDAFLEAAEREVEQLVAPEGNE